MISDPNTYLPAHINLYDHYKRFMHIRTLLFAVILSLSTNIHAQSVKINEVMTANVSSVLDLQYYNFSEWIELYNPGAIAVQVSHYFLSNDPEDVTKWQIPGTTYIPARGYLVIWLDKQGNGLHTNYRARTNKEIFILLKPDGSLADSVRIEYPEPDCSFGRNPDGSSNWSTFLAPSPGNANGGPVPYEQSPEPVFSLQGGRYGSPVSVELTNPSGGGSIYYSVDGNEPSQKSEKYSGPFLLSKTTTVRARIIQQGNIPGMVITNTYFINEHPSSLPLVSVSASPKYLWDPMLGIYTEGTNGVEGYCYGAANWNRDWERPAHFEFYNTDGKRKINVDAGLKIAGGCSRTFPQKSLALHFRDKYGPDHVSYPFFNSKAVDHFKSIMLRNSGNDFNRTHFQDGLMQTLVENQLDIDYLGYAPAAAYLNGEYWGILNIREKSTEDYLYSNYGLKQDEVDLLEWHSSVIAGDNTAYLALLTYMENHDLSVAENYQYVVSQVDVESYIDYQIAEIFFANHDWPGNNMKFWRARKAGSKWRWIMFDTDFGFGLFTGPDDNTLTYATATNSTHWGNPDWATFFFRKMLESETFRKRFVEKFLAYTGSAFRTERMLHIIDSLKNNIAGEILHHFERWGGSEGDWEWNINTSRNFAMQRPGIITGYLQDFFGLGPVHSLQIKSNRYCSGSFSLNGVVIRDTLYNGYAFDGQQVTIQALQNNTHKFSHWEIEKYRISNDTVISRLSSWKYYDRGTPPLSTWKMPDYDDHDWSSGYAQFGYGEGDEATVLDYGSDPGNKYPACYFRKTFHVNDTAGANMLSIKLLVDDGAVIYLNGHEILRHNMPAGEIFYDTWAAAGPSDENTYVHFSLKHDWLLPGENTVAVEVHQISAGSSDVSFDLELLLHKIYERQHETSPFPRLSLIINTEVTARAIFIPVPVISKLFINEVCAKNTTIPDDFYEYDDWIEIYNAGADDLDLGGLFLTNDMDEPFMCRIPEDNHDESTIHAGEYKLLWADEDPDQGPMHLDFKLDRNGGEVALIECYGDTAMVIDSVFYPELDADQSFGRYSDGTDRWFVLTGITPGASNIYTDLPDHAFSGTLAFSPNPVQDHGTLQYSGVSSEPVQVTLYDHLGRIVMSYPLVLKPEDNQIEFSGLPEGMYYLMIVGKKGIYNFKILKLY
jgi:hypothetical protein